MTLAEILSLLSKYEITVHQDDQQLDGSRVIILAGRLPSIPYGYNRMAYYTLVLSRAEDNVPLEIREAIRRRMCHLSTDIFGDDASDIIEEMHGAGDSHFQAIVPKR